jgi:hypothetical protein
MLLCCAAPPQPPVCKTVTWLAGIIRRHRMSIGRARRKLAVLHAGSTGLTLAWHRRLLCRKWT